MRHPLWVRATMCVMIAVCIGLHLATSALV